MEGSSNHKESVTARTDGHGEVTALNAKRPNAEPAGGDGQTSEKLDGVGEKC